MDGRSGDTKGKKERKKERKERKEGATIAMHASPNCPVGVYIGYVPNSYNRRVSLPVITNGQVLVTCKNL